MPQPQPLSDPSSGVVLVPSFYAGVVGIDEVGRGVWAGPLLVAAALLAAPPPPKLTDSKKMSRPARQAMARLLRETGTHIGFGWVPAAEVDAIGLGPALKLGAKRALAQLNAPYTHIVIDGSINLLPGRSNVTVLPRADALVPAVSAASVLAKVARDTYMNQIHRADPRYGFNAHVGYGTALHAARLAKHGIGPQHRRSVAPIKRLMP